MCNQGDCIRRLGRRSGALLVVVAIAILVPRAFGGTTKRHGRLEMAVWFVPESVVSFTCRKSEYKTKWWYIDIMFGTVQYREVMDRSYVGTYNLSTGDVRILRTLDHPGDKDHEDLEIVDNLYPIVLCVERRWKDGKEVRVKYLEVDARSGKSREVPVAKALSKRGLAVVNSPKLIQSSGTLLVWTEESRGVSANGRPDYELWQISTDGDATRFCYSSCGFAILNNTVFFCEPNGAEAAGSNVPFVRRSLEDHYCAVDLNTRVFQRFATYPEFAKVRDEAATHEYPGLTVEGWNILIHRTPGDAKDTTVVSIPFARIR